MKARLFLQSKKARLAIHREALDDFIKVIKDLNFETDIAEVERWKAMAAADESLDLVGYFRIVGKITLPDYTGSAMITYRPLHSQFSAKRFHQDIALKRLTGQALHEKGIPAQRVLLEGGAKGNNWALTTYIVGNDIGWVFAFDRHLLKEKLLDDWVKTRQALSDLKPMMPKRSVRLKVWRHEFAVRYQNLERIIGKVQAGELSSIFKRSLLQSAERGITHADLSPNNIIWDGRNFHFIDWGDSHLNTRAVDWLTLWMYCWQNQRYQRQIEQALLADYPDEKSAAEGILASEVSLIRRLSKLAEQVEYFVRSDPERYEQHYQKLDLPNDPREIVQILSQQYFDLRGRFKLG